MAIDVSMAHKMILLTQMMFKRCLNDVLLMQNDVRTRANLGMALIIYTPRGVMTYSLRLITYVYYLNNYIHA